jgi:hypothetical protein
MRTVILVPRRSDNGHRDTLWEWCKERWGQILPDAQIYEGHHNEGLFNRSAAINLAAKLADKDGRWDMALVIDGDIFIRRSQARKAIETARKTGKVTWAHTRWREITEDWTKRLTGPKNRRQFNDEITGFDMDVLVRQTTPISWSCCIAVPRAVWDQVGGFDERFIGWGFEDHAFRAVVCGLHGWNRLPGDVYHLWHERTTDGSGRASKNGGTYTAEAITNAQLGRRYMIAVLRDHGIGDQVGQEHLKPEEAEVHIRNLKTDLEKFAGLAKRYGMPDWTNWWPTLEELNRGAKAYRKEQAQPKVTIVVHTGGTLEAWPERREYLRQSVTSLVEKVTGPIIQRVIYDCWGDAGIRAWLSEEFGPLGFYVVGPENPVDYTGSMKAMWRYLSKRAKGEYIFMAEDDFTYERPVDLHPMIEALGSNPHLVQMALLRDAFYQDEQETGGILGWPEPAFDRKHDWLEHNLFFTANPSLFRRALTATAWPSGHHSETLFGKIVFADKRNRAAFWGQGEEWIKHIGRVRAGVGY